MTLGPVEMFVLTFPGERVGREVVEAIQEVVDREVVTILDLVFCSRSADGEVRIVELDEDPEDFGFGTLRSQRLTLTSDEDLAVVRDAMEPGTSAAVIVFENTWARRVAAALVHAGGEVALHVRIPRETAESALSVAAGND